MSLIINSFEPTRRTDQLIWLSIGLLNAVIGLIFFNLSALIPEIEHTASNFILWGSILVIVFQILIFLIINPFYKFVKPNIYSKSFPIKRLWVWGFVLAFLFGIAFRFLAPGPEDFFNYDYLICGYLLCAPIYVIVPLPFGLAIGVYHIKRRWEEYEESTATE
jgi:hypothetical protein